MTDRRSDFNRFSKIANRLFLALCVCQCERRRARLIRRYDTLDAAMDARFERGERLELMAANEREMNAMRRVIFG